MSAYRNIIAEYPLFETGGMVIIYEENSKFTVEAKDENEDIFLTSRNIETLDAANHKAKELSYIF